MDGLLLHLLEDKLGAPGRWFWPCFKSVRDELNAHHWIFENQPWMGAPETFLNDDSATDDFVGPGQSGVSLWRPHALARWANHFAEESISLWAVKPADDPRKLASAFQRLAAAKADEFITTHASLWLLYTDSTCWEIFATRPALLEMIEHHLIGQQSIRVYRSESDHRGRAFGAAGLSNVWRATKGLH